MDEKQDFRSVFYGVGENTPSFASRNWSRIELISIDYATSSTVSALPVQSLPSVASLPTNAEIQIASTRGVYGKYVIIAYVSFKTILIC